MIKKTLKTLSTLLLVGPVIANADPIVITTLVDGVESTLEATFPGEGMQCNVIAAFDGCDSTEDFTFDNEAEAISAMDLILAHLTDLADAIEHFGTLPTGTVAFASIPFRIDNTRLFAVIGRCNRFGCARIPSGETRPGSTPGAQFGTWVVLSSSVSVPEPSTLTLLGIGLFGMGAARRRKV